MTIARSFDYQIALVTTRDVPGHATRRFVIEVIDERKERRVRSRCSLRLCSIKTAAAKTRADKRAVGTWKGELSHYCSTFKVACIHGCK